MSSRADTLLRGTLLAAAVMLGGCYQHRVCGTPEVCNYEDDDCDGAVDEDFRDEEGRYVTVEHCGACDVACATVFPTASETACEVGDAATPECVIVACPEGFHRAGDGACVPDVPVLCLPCEGDSECELGMPGAVCFLGDGEDEGRCLPPCDLDGLDGCPLGFECDGATPKPLCVPVLDGDFCACTGENLGVEFGCLLARDDGYRCAGVQVCLESGLTACEPALDEICNLADDDCDFGVDEDFRDAEGRYVVDPLHCGTCASPCVPPGPNMVAECVADDSEPDDARCDVACEEGFVDVDGILANGCECMLVPGGGPPVSVGGDGDCDGVPDDNDDFVYVTPNGNDADDGSLDSPKRTIQAGIAAADAMGRDVLVARGVYEGPIDLVSGVGVFGGYRSDFRDRDLALYPVLVEAPAPGMPAMRCTGITAATPIDGLTLEGSDASTAGQGSTTLYLDGCGPDVSFHDVVIFAGRGAPGRRGDDSSENLADVGAPSLAALDGNDGSSGSPGTSGGFCTTIVGGAAGTKTCDGVNVSGGGGGAGACPNIGCNQVDACANAGCTDFTVGGVCDIDAVLELAVANPAPTPAHGTAPGLRGEPTYNSPTNRGICHVCDDNPTLNRDGDRGSDGGAGVDGIGGLGCFAAPILDVATGRVRGLAGGNGGEGTSGSGGGGGSSGAGYAVIPGTVGGCTSRAGGSGGGGGSGGCGAPRADGGEGGGASIGVVVRLTGGAAAGPTFDAVRIVTTSGGDGGDGGQGAAGGAPGVGAPGGSAQFWCARNGGRGGDGGRGGAGGGGGGGCGGGSHAVYVDADATVTSYAAALAAGIEVDATGIAGRAGRGGFSPVNSGTDGLSGDDAAIFVAP